MKAASGCPKSILERLADTAPGLEIWWDSSPIVFPKWKARLLEQAAPEKRACLGLQLDRLYDPERPGEGLFKGVTSNPPLSYAVVKEDPAYWTGWVRDTLLGDAVRSPEPAAWALYREIIQRGARAYLPVFEKTGFRYGYMSAQVDPRALEDRDRMLGMAGDLASLSPNVIVKIPASRAGIAVLEELTSRGIPTNVTLCYVMSQFIAAAEAVLRGVDRARANRVDLTRWRSVVTDMGGRWENAPEFAAQAKDAGLELSPEEIRWAGIAIFKRAYRIFRERAYPSKLLLCSMRVGPQVGGAARIWHLEHTAGADAVFTFPPLLLDPLLTQLEDIEFQPRIWEEIPREVFRRLAGVPYFSHSIDEDGYAIEEFDTLPAMIHTRQEFSAAMENLLGFVRDIMGTRVAPV